MSVKPRANRPNMFGRFDMDGHCVLCQHVVQAANIIEHVQKCWEPSPTFSLFLDVGQMLGRFARGLRIGL